MRIITWANLAGEGKSVRIYKYDYKATAELQWVLLVPCWKIHKQTGQFLPDIQFPEPASITLIFSLSHIIKRQAPPLLYGCAHMYGGWLVCFVYTILVHVCSSTICVFRFTNWMISEKHNLHLKDKNSYKVRVNGLTNQFS